MDKEKSAKERSGIQCLARRIREYMSLIRAIYDAPEPGTSDYINKQRELVRHMSEEHILSEDPNEAIMEFIGNGDAKLYCEGAAAKKKLKDISHLNGRK